LGSATSNSGGVAGPKIQDLVERSLLVLCSSERHPAHPGISFDRAGLSCSCRSLLSSACLNIKKSAGDSNSNNDDVQFYADHDGDLIKREIELISPDIVISGSTWWAVKQLWPAARQVYDLVWKTDTLSFIDFWHPANQFPNALNYYALGCLIQNGVRPESVA
jgi:hypothetical protein